MEVEFTGLVGLIIAAFLAAVAVFVGVRKPKFLDRPVFVEAESEEHTMVGISDRQVEQAVKGQIEEHCRKMREQIAKQENGHVKLCIAESINPLKDMLVEWKGGVDAKLVGVADNYSVLREDIRQLRKEISQLRQDLNKS